MRVKWTDFEDAIVLDHWMKPGMIRDFMHLLPGRSKEGIEKRAKKLGLPNRHAVTEWAPAMDGLLRKVWKSQEPLKEKLHLFKGRTLAALNTRAYELGLGRRPNHKKGPRSIMWPIIKKQLKAGPADCFEVAKTLRIHSTTARIHLVAHHEANELHIVDWKRRTGLGAPVPVYALEAGVDVPKPLPMTSAEKDRRIRQRAKEQRICAAEPVRGINPFSTIIQQLAA